MSTLTTYAELKSRIQDYGKRSDCLSMLDIFIDACEVDIWEHLRVREMEARATATCSTADRFVELPTGFLEMRLLRISNTDGRNKCEIPHVIPQSIQIIDTAGRPYEYTTTTQLQFNRVPDQEYPLEMNYWRKLTALSSSNTSNDILTNYPMVYLSGCMKHFYEWALNEQKAMYWENQFMKRIASANFSSRKARSGPNPAMVVSGMVV